MRLLLDQNLSPRLLTALADQYPRSVHVREVGLHAADDDTVWRYAAEHGFAIVSKDADFRERSFLRGHPPKVIGFAAGTARPTRPPQFSVPITPTCLCSSATRRAPSWRSGRLRGERTSAGSR